MRPGDPAICTGTVLHRRTYPTVHQFTYPIQHLWLDPDRPDILTKQHGLWSHVRVSPGRFRRSDYGIASNRSLVSEVISDLEPVLGYEPRGEVRMVTQVRRWGWLFNPITLFLAWDEDETNPVGAVLEVTNTPWKERYRYPIALQKSDGSYRASFSKELHVSPFLDQEFVYEFSMVDSDDEAFYKIDVVRPTGETVVRTTARMQRETATHQGLSRALRKMPLSTRQVSVGIHSQAVRLMSKRVPFVSHPTRRESA